MKLFVWNNPYSVSWGGSCLYVMAEDEEQARERAKTAIDASFGEVGPNNRTKCLADLGPPDRIYDGPVAEFYEWSE